jgi:5-methylcytosine-specific restriction protein B
MTIHSPRAGLLVMAVYQGLLAAGRIEFVTFHQSMAYEEFVEGRQPMTGADDGEDTSSAGFRLETVPGIFRRIARRAEVSRGTVSSGTKLSLEGRRVFKMSIGAKYLPEDAPLFEEAIEKNCAIFGFYEFDLSDPRFSTREAIHAAAEARRKEDPEAFVSQPATMMTNLFRNSLKVGDVLIVTKGNLLVRAIGTFFTCGLDVLFQNVLPNAIRILRCARRITRQEPAVLCQPTASVRQPVMGLFRVRHQDTKIFAS